MVITFVSDTFQDSDNETAQSALRFAEALAERGHAIRVVTQGDPARSGRDEKTGFEMFYLPERKIPFVSRLAKKQNALFAKPVCAVLERAISGADAVHIFQPWALGRAARKTARKLGVPAVAAFYIQPEHIAWNIGLGGVPFLAHLIYFLLNRFFYRRFDHIHCPSKSIAAQLRTHGYKARLHVVSSGVRPGPVPPVSPPEPSDTVGILVAGRLSPEKRPDLILRAAALSRHARRIQLYFAGSGPLEAKLRKMGKGLPNPPVFGLFDREALLRLMGACRLYVHASEVEAEGLDCLEAMAGGLIPVIADSRRSAAVQFALDPRHLFRAGSPGALAEKIDEWLDQPWRMERARREYLLFAREFTTERSARKMENVYASLAVKERNAYHRGVLFRLLTLLFQRCVATPLLLIWTHFVLGVRVYGRKNLRGLKSVLTVCNHVHLLDSALIGLAFFPRRVIFPTIPKNIHSLWPGVLVQVLGGVAIPDNIRELKTFFDEMEFLLIKNCVVHFFPEGELIPYDTTLRDFKKGAFYLAARARVPIVPMTIRFEAPRGLLRLVRKKPVMRLHIGRPVYPAAADFKLDSALRMKAVREQMEAL